MPSPARQSDVDACPGALRLHAAADGPLARVRLPGGMLTGHQLAVLGDLARIRGDGRLELTSRANVQLRALTGADPDELAARLSAAGLLPSATHETVRNIAAPPLAGPALRALVGRLDRELCAEETLAGLPGRFLFAIGAVTLGADVAAVPGDDGYALLLGGVPAGPPLPYDDVVPTLLAAARAFLEVRGDALAWRLRELPDGPDRVAASLGLSLVPRPAVASATPSLIGLVPQPDGLVAAGALVPLGQLTAAAIESLATAGRLVVTPSRGVLVPDLSSAGAAGLLRSMAAAGLAVEAESRWSGVTACAGRPGCAKSLADVRADADAATTGFVDGLPVHWIGCARGCGSPPGEHVRVEATPAGYAVGQSAVAVEMLSDLVAQARRRP